MLHRASVRFSARWTFIILFLALLFSAEGAANSYIVRSTADAGVHSLRWALMQANTSPGLDVITFDLDGDGPFVITPYSPLPPLTDTAGTVIDGISQTGATAGPHPPSTLSLLIHIDGSRAGETSGLFLLSSNNLIRGLVITGFQEDGIRIQGTKAGTHSNEIRHCIIGMSAGGDTPHPNGTKPDGGRWGGIRLVNITHDPGPVFDNMIFQNLISGNVCDGVVLASGNAGAVNNNAITENHIGTDISGKKASGNKRNGILLYGGCSENTVSKNIIGGNQANGIHVVGVHSRAVSASDNRIEKNYIGISPLLHDIGNTRNGITIGGPADESACGYAIGNTVFDNIIARNGRSGITTFEHESTSDNADGNRLSQNTVFANRGIAIDLGRDGRMEQGDGNTTSGSINTPKPPEFHFIEAFSGVTVIRGSVNRTLNPTTMRVELYRHKTFPTRKEDLDLYLGSATPDGAGNWKYSTSRGLASGDSVVALVIDENGNSSEYSVPHEVGMGGGYSMNAPPKSRNSVPSVRRIAKVSQSNVDSEGGASFTITVEKDCWSIMEIFTPGSELVSTIVDRWLPAGTYTFTWDGTNWRGEPVEAGTYLCRLDAAGASHNISVFMQ